MSIERRSPGSAEELEEVICLEELNEFDVLLSKQRATEADHDYGICFVQFSPSCILIQEYFLVTGERHLDFPAWLTIGARFNRIVKVM